MPDPRRALESRLATIAGVVVSESMFGNGPGYWCHGKEIAHFERDGRVEVRLTKPLIRARRPEFKADPRIDLRPSGADWISARFESDEDVVFITELVEAAATVHRPPPGTPSKLPPQGADLRRRQRFH